MQTTAIQSHRWLILAGAGLLAILAPIFVNIDVRIAFGLFGVLAVGIALSKLFPDYGIHLYLVYLSLDGAIKMLSHYHKVLHVFSDILLIGSFGLILLSRSANPHIGQIDLERRKQIFTSFSFLLIYWTWILVQFFNPWGLGLIPSLASFKVYIVPNLTFILVAFFAKDHEVRLIPIILLAMGVCHAVVALLDWSFGMAFWPAIDPFYLHKYEIFKLGVLGGDNYRPFGLTAVPGLPAIFILYGILGGFLALHVVNNEARLYAIKKVRYTVYALLLAMIPLGIWAQLVCQVRTTLVRTLIIICTGVVLWSRKAALIGTIAVPVLLSAFFAVQVTQPIGRTDDNFEERRFANIMLRAQSLGDVNIYKHSRHGALSRMLDLGSYTTMGTGLGYGAPHVGMWNKYVAESPLKQFTYAENVYNFLFNELGIWGLLSWIMTVFSVLYFLIKKKTYASLLISVYIVFVLASGFGAEITFSQPDASLFWLLAAWGLRYKPSGTNVLGTK